MSKLKPGQGGFKLSPTIPTNSTITVYAAGTAYALTTTAALLDFGTTDPSITLTPGTWLLLGRVVLDYNAATFAASRVVTLTFRRTNNTPADLPNGSMTVDTEITTTVTATFGDFVLPFIIDSTTSSAAGDIIQIFGSVAVAPTAGSLDAVAAEIVAIRLS